MKAGWVATMLVALAMGGCAAGGPANPNFAAAKVVLQPRPEGNVTAFVHAAFGEHSYEWIALSVDNESLANRTLSFSLEEILPPAGFFLDAEAGTADEVYELRARVDPDPEDPDRLLIAFLDADGEWSDPDSFDLPFVRVLNRRESP